MLANFEDGDDGISLPGLRAGVCRQRRRRLRALCSEEYTLNGPPLESSSNPYLLDDLGMLDFLESDDPCINFDDGWTLKTVGNFQTKFLQPHCRSTK